METDQQAEGAAGVEPEGQPEPFAEAQAEAKERQRLMRHVSAAYGIFKRRKVGGDDKDFGAFINDNFVPGDLQPPSADDAKQAQQAAEEAMRVATELAAKAAGTGQAE